MRNKKMKIASAAAASTTYKPLSKSKEILIRRRSWVSKYAARFRRPSAKESTIRRTPTMMAPAVAKFGQPVGKVDSRMRNRRPNDLKVLDAIPTAPIMSRTRAARTTFQRDPSGLFTLIQPSFKLGV
jgi:hypothetical protein